MRGLIIIPAYNEENVIENTLNQFKNKSDDWDILVVDDGSKDQTADIVKKQNVRVVSLPINLGIGTAVQTGYKVACREDYDWALQFDADGQHLVEEISKLLKEIGQNACVVGSRYIEKNFKSSLPRRMGAYYFSHLLHFLGCDHTTDPSSGFRLCDRRAIALFANHYPHDYPEVEARLLLKNRQLPLSEVPVHMAPRQGGKSSIGFFDSYFYIVKVTISLLLGGGR